MIELFKVLTYCKFILYFFATMASSIAKNRSFFYLVKRFNWKNLFSQPMQGREFEKTDLINIIVLK